MAHGNGPAWLLGSFPRLGLCAALVRSVKRGCEGYLVTQLLALLCASVQFRGNLHHFFPCLSGTNARVSLLERDGSTDRSLCL